MAQQTILAILLLVVLLVVLRRNPKRECPSPPKERPREAEERPRQPRGDALSSKNNLVLADENANILTVPVKSMFLEDFKKMSPDQVNILGRLYLGGYGNDGKDWSGLKDSWLRIGVMNAGGKITDGDLQARNTNFTGQLTVHSYIDCEGDFYAKSNTYTSGGAYVTGNLSGGGDLYVKGNMLTSEGTATAKIVEGTEKVASALGQFMNANVGKTLKVGQIELNEYTLAYLLFKNGFAKTPGVEQVIYHK